MDRTADPKIAEMPDRIGLPRKSGELVFHDVWEQRAFAIAVALAQAGHFHWSEFQQRLSTAIAEAEQADLQHPTRDYYESWLASLESLLAERGLLD